MKKILFFLLFFVNFIFPEIKGRIYVDPDKIYINEKEIVVNTDSGKYYLSAIHVDKIGIYFTKDAVYGECPFCGHPTTSSGQCETPDCPMSKRND